MSKFAELCGGLSEFHEKKAGLEDMDCLYFKYMEELEVEMFGKQGSENSLSVDEVLEVYERRDYGSAELEKQGLLGTPEALQLADALCPLELEENAMYFQVMEANK